MANKVLLDLVSALEIPVVVKDTALRIFIECKRAHIMRGHSIDATVRASMIAAARIYKFPLVFDDLASENLSKNKIIHYFKAIASEILPKLGISPGKTPVRSFLVKYCENLGIPSNIQVIAIDWLKEIGNGDLGGKDPKGMVAAAIYMATRGVSRLTQDQISEGCGISSVTLRRYTRQLAGDADAPYYQQFKRVEKPVSRKKWPRRKRKTSSNTVLVEPKTNE